MKYQVIIVGAGASGLMCAMTASKRGRSVLVLDHADRPGEKIRISGGGLCNFTNLHVDAGHYLSENPKFCMSALSRYTPNDFLSLLKRHGVLYSEREHGQLFCKRTAQEIVALLLDECLRFGVTIHTRCDIKEIKREVDFIIETQGDTFNSESLAIATGGLSNPAIGASGFGYDLAERFLIKVNAQRPGLVPLIMDKKVYNYLPDLAGISITAVVSCNGVSFRDKILFTHKGLSGPAILQISNYWEKGMEIVLDLLPDINLLERIKVWRSERPKAELKTLLSKLLPRRLVSKWFELSHHNKAVNQCSYKEIITIAQSFKSWVIKPSATEGYCAAEVTKGGVDTRELSSKTFETRKVKGLYFIGEVLDVTGQLGGYNLHWAWASGYCAGLYV